jgi:hypothetical protein
MMVVMEESIPEHAGKSKRDERAGPGRRRAWGVRKGPASGAPSCRVSLGFPFGRNPGLTPLLLLGPGGERRYTKHHAGAAGPPVKTLPSPRPNRPGIRPAAARAAASPGGCGVLILVFLPGGNPVKYADPDGNAVLATADAYREFHREGISFSRNSYDRPNSHLYSSIGFYNIYGNFSRLSNGGNNYQTKEQMNRNALGSNVFNFFSGIADKYADAIVSGIDIRFTSTLMKDKYDNSNNQFYELSININGEESVLFYYSSVEGRTEDQILKLVGDLFSSLKGGEIDDWKPKEGTKINGDVP